MKRHSASTLIYFHERVRKKSQIKRPRHVNKEKQARHIRTILGLVIVLILMCFGIRLYVKYQPLDIKSVEIDGAQRFVNAQDVRKVTEETSLDRNILSVDPNNLEEIISSNFLASKSVEVSRRFPKTIKVLITERVPIALILPKEKGDFYFIDAEGFVLGIADKSATNLPVINYSQEVEVGKFVEATAVAYYFDLIKALDADEVYVSTISSYPRYTQFFTKDNTQVYFTNDQFAVSQVKVFKKMMEAFKAEGKKVRKIDLRFDKVIVEFNKD